MGLAVSNIRLLTLTSRKADCEYNISIDSMEKMALTRQQSELSKEYYAKLKAKTISYYSNGQYNMVNYSYLMGNSSISTNLFKGDLSNIKKDFSMVLTDHNGFVVMNDNYASVLKSILGSNCIDANGRGGTFSMDKIPAIIAHIAGGCTEEEVKAIIDNDQIQSSYDTYTTKTISGEVVSSGNSYDNSDSYTDKIARIVSYYYPIFQAAAANGWTTEYNVEMNLNNSYISDALVSGAFQLQQIDSVGEYKPDASLTYFTTRSLVIERNDSQVREEVTAWYNAEKEALNEKESWLDMEISDLSTELEAINTEMEAVKSLLQDNMNVFDWCNG